jgi:outer membrane receptor protein involved in Fe transport
MVLFAGAPCYAAEAAAAASAPGATEIGEVVVTASRRSEDISKLPFNVSAYSAQQLERANVTNVTQLSQQVPSFTVRDEGARNAEASVPIIRGVNASGFAGSAPRYSQAPVGIYQGNAPLTGSFPIMDLERVEVLRGPQGTLYGAGALAGAVRLVPAAPSTSGVSGSISASGSEVEHAHKPSYDVGGYVNIPLGDTAAFRLTAKHQYDAGFIDRHDIMRRQGDDYRGGAPLLGNPADVANSQAVYFNKSGANYTETTAVRASGLWKPTDQLKLEASYSYARIKGEGGPIDNYTYPGGPSPIDPRVQLAPTGEYERSGAMLEPYDRTSHLATLDGSYDLGFATLSSTLAYGRTRGANLADATSAILGTPTGAFYYTGSPANPRAVIPVENADVGRTYTEEVRLVSRTGGRFDYVAGAFFEQQKREIGLAVFDPGADAQSAAAHGGSTTPIALGGTYLPLFTDNASYRQSTFQRFKEQSAYGDLTWHVTDKWQVTGGLRVFHQTFTQRLTQDSSLFFFTVDTTNKTSTTSQIFKANTSYQWDEHNQVYFTFSQGFRRGGANAFPTDGPILEPTALLNYAPDKADNYEFGAKGSLFGLRYSADIFYIDWSKPQIDTVTPVNLTYVVVNAKAATSKGIEAEVSGPIGPQGLSFVLGFAYAKARLSEDFALPAGDGLGHVVPNSILGHTGDRLPGAPDFSASGTLNYELRLADENTLNFSFGADYRGSTVGSLPTSTLPATRAPGYALLRASIGYDRKDWRVEVFATNLTNEHAVLLKTPRNALSLSQVGAWGDTYTVTQPRVVGLRLTRNW